MAEGAARHRGPMAADGRSTPLAGWACCGTEKHSRRPTRWPSSSDVTARPFWPALDSPRSTSELAGLLGVTGGGVSQQLSVLAQAGLVTAEGPVQRPGPGPCAPPAATRSSTSPPVPTPSLSRRPDTGRRLRRLQPSRPFRSRAKPGDAVGMVNLNSHTARALADERVRELTGHQAGAAPAPPRAHPPSAGNQQPSERSGCDRRAADRYTGIALFVPAIPASANRDAGSGRGVPFRPHRLTGAPGANRDSRLRLGSGSPWRFWRV